MCYIGQTRLVNQIDQLDTMPQFIIIAGDKGSGKTWISNYISNSIHANLLSYNDIKIDTIRDINEDAQTLTANKVYHLQKCDEMTIQAENALLKIAEEPPRYCYIIMEVTDVDNLLPTIISRARVFTMDRYTQSELKEFCELCDIENDRLMEICTTPGRIIELKDDFEDLYKFTEKVLNNITGVTWANMLKIPSYINLTKEPIKEKYDLISFIDTLKYICNIQLKDNFTLSSKRISILNECRGKLKIKGIDKQSLIDWLLISLRRAGV